MRGLQALPARFMLGHLEIDAVMGTGGFGVTYRAIDRRTRQRVAVKEYFPRNAAMRAADGGVWVISAREEPLFRWGLDRFQEEARTLARFNHNYIVRVLQIFAANGTAYIVLDYIDGPSLQQWIRCGGTASQEELDGFAAGFLDALETIHRSGVLHRDIAPKNILLSMSGHPVLIDFGAARQMVHARTSPLTKLVTPRYSPYEQYTNSERQGPWTDIYATAATVYEILTGKPPPESPGRTLRDTCVPVVRAARAPCRRAFLDAVDWALRPLPQDRPQSVRDWRLALLRHAGSGLAPGLRTEQIAGPPPR